MEPIEFKPNSHRSKEEQAKQAPERRKIEKVVKGAVKTRDNGMRKFVNTFIPNNGKDVKTYAVHDVLIPSVKKAFWEIFEMFWWGRDGRRSGKRTVNDYVSYAKFSGSKDDRHGSENSSNRTPYSYKDIVLESRADAEEVLMQMDAIIEEYGMVSVADLYEMVGEDFEFTDNKYGWTNLRSAEVQRVRDGYLVKVPRAEHLK